MKKNTPKWLIVHHEAGGNGFYGVNEYHRKRWNFKSGLGLYIGYHYYIEKSGKAYQGRLDLEEGAHCIGLNTRSIGIGLEGHFNREYPTKEQKTALRGLLNELRAKYNIPLERIVPHRRFANTDCYGTNLSDNFAMDLVKNKGEREKVLIELRDKVITLLELMRAKLKRLIEIRKNKGLKLNKTK